MTHTVQLAVEHADHQTRYYPANRGWRIDAASRCILIGRDLPRTYVPLDDVFAFTVERVDQAADASQADVQNLLDAAALEFADARTSSERVEAVRDLLAGWYAAWPASAVTDEHEGIAHQIVALVYAAEARASTPPAAAITVDVERPDDEHIEIHVNGQMVASANHDEHGWSGMDAVERTALAVARAAGCNPAEA